MKKLYLLIIFFVSVLTSTAQTWDSVGIGVDNGISHGSVRSFTKYNEKLIVGGGFSSAGGIAVNNIASWDGTTWSVLGNGTYASAIGMINYNEELYAGILSDFYTCEKWNGSSWSYINYFSDAVQCFAEYNQEIYAGGYFQGGIKKWNGVDFWYTVSGGTIGGPIFALTVFNDELYAAGYFNTAGNIPVNNIAKWNGTTWLSVGTGLNHIVRALTVHNGELYAGGRFTLAGSNPVNCVAKWDGTNWSSVGIGIDSIVPYEGVFALCSFNDELYAGGGFVRADGNPVSNLAKWDGVNWSALGSGVDSTVYALYAYNNQLYAGGLFSSAGGITSSRIARWTPAGIGIEENNNNLEASIFPNPFSSITTITLNKELRNAILSVNSIQGKEIRNTKFNGKSAVIQKEDLAAGLYIYKITSESEVIATGKIIVQ